jgi:Family of unknown function (DUF6356)
MTSIQNFGDDHPAAQWHSWQIGDAIVTEPTRNPFTAHPHALNETYIQHLGHALGYSGRMFAAGFCALTHAIFPFLFEKTASTIVKKMYAEMTSRGATQAVDASPAAKVYPAE